MDRLKYFTRRIQNDLMILRTVHDMPVDDLIGRIDQTFQKYESTTTGYLMDAHGIVLEDLEKTWQRVVRN